MGRARLPGGWAQTGLDLALVCWTAWWLWAGIAVGHEVRGLGDLSDTAGTLGRAVTSVGDAVSGLPLVGGDVHDAGKQVSAAGQDAVASARSARGSARRLGALLGVSIAAIPSLPVLFLYLPARIATARERRALAAALRDQPRAELDEVLARRAVVHLPYRLLRRVSDDPAGDLRDGTHERLADAELAWFGVSRPAARSRPARR